MDIFALDIAEIGELVTQVATAGDMLASWGSDQVFEMTVGIAQLIYETYPG